MSRKLAPTPAMTPCALSRRAGMLGGIIALGILGGLGARSEVRAATIDTWTGPGRFPVGERSDLPVVDRTRSTPPTPLSLMPAR